MSARTYSVLVKLLMFAMVLLAGSGLYKHDSETEHVHDKIHELKQGHEQIIEKLNKMDSKLNENR